MKNEESRFSYQDPNLDLSYGLSICRRFSRFLGVDGGAPPCVVGRQVASKRNWNRTVLQAS